MKKTAIAAILATLVGSAFALDADSPNRAISSSFSTATKTFSVLWVKSDKPTGPDFSNYVVTNITQEKHCYEVIEANSKVEFNLLPGQFWTGDITAREGETGSKLISIKNGICEKPENSKGGLNIREAIAKTIHIRGVGDKADKADEPTREEVRARIAKTLANAEARAASDLGGPRMVVEPAKDRADSPSQGSKARACLSVAKNIHNAALESFKSSGVEGLKAIQNAKCDQGEIQVLLTDLKTGKPLNGRDFDKSLTLDLYATKTFGAPVGANQLANGNSMSVVAGIPGPLMGQEIRYETLITRFDDALLTVYGGKVYREAGEKYWHD